jgi:hypothetical protein
MTARALLSRQSATICKLLQWSGRSTDIAAAKSATICKRRQRRPAAGWSRAGASASGLQACSAARNPTLVPDPRHAFAPHPLTLAGGGACSDRPIGPCAAPRQPARRVFPPSFQRVRSFPSPAFRIAVGARACIFIVINNLPRLFCCTAARISPAIEHSFRSGTWSHLSGRPRGARRMAGHQPTTRERMYGII